MKAVALLVDGTPEPLSTASATPRFSWRVHGSSHNLFQSAYRILVASSPRLLESLTGDLWDSGRVVLPKAVDVAYEGKPLSSRQPCFWRVLVWDKDGRPGEWSATSPFQIGLLCENDWAAHWLAAEDDEERSDRLFGLRWVWPESSNGHQTVQFRFLIDVPEDIRRGRFFVAGREQPYESIRGVWFNGMPLAPPEDSDPSAHWLEIPAVRAGTQVIAIEVGVEDPPQIAGLENQHALTIFGRLALASGQTLRFSAEPPAKVGSSAGPDWTKPDFDDAAWRAPCPVSVAHFAPYPPSPPMLFHRSFELDRTPVAARLRASALGAYHVTINDQPAGNALLTPEPSQVSVRLLYQTFDVSRHLRLGINRIALTVADGWYASFNGYYAWGRPPRRGIAQLELTFSDGSEWILGTDESWRAGRTPIRQSQVRVGETWDYRNDDALPDTAARIAPKPDGRLVAQCTPPIRELEAIDPVAITEANTGVYVADFGRCFAGRCRLAVRTKRPIRIEMRYAENISSDGQIDQESLGAWLLQEPKRDIFSLPADTEAVLEARFSYRSLRFVEISGLDEPPRAGEIQGVVIGSDLAQTGDFSCEEPLLNRLWNVSLQTQKANLVGISTDCPGREQLGWLADAALVWDSWSYGTDLRTMSRRRLADIADAQLAGGEIPMFAPIPTTSRSYFDRGNTPGWSCALVELTWLTWQHFGDVSAIEIHWPAIERYLASIEAHNPDHTWAIRRGWDFGEWLEPAGTPQDPDEAETAKRLFATAYWSRSLARAVELAKAIGRFREAGRLQLQLQKVRTAFRESFVHASGCVGRGTQTEQVLALRFGLLPRHQVRAAAQILADDVARGPALSTGMHGTAHVLDVLCEHGFQKIAFDALLSKTFPSWGHMLDNGATTLWESWSGWFDEGPIAGRRAAQNHVAFSSVGGFLVRHILGIRAATPGFEYIRIQPRIDERIPAARGWRDTVAGRVEVCWRRTGTELRLQTSLPPNTSGLIHLPASRTDDIEESGAGLTDRRDVRLLRRGRQEALVAVGNGDFDFSVRGR
jgi:alpha-L-rhamnosidase